MTTPNEFRFKDKLGVLDIIYVEYKAAHKVLEEIDISLDTEINIPHSYLNALLYFVASRFHVASVQPLDNERGEGMVYARKYQQELMLLSNQGIDVESPMFTDTFSSRGFV
jgi:hypothetical protein